MTSWQVHGRPLLLDALANACDVIDEQIRAELQGNAREKNDLLAEIGNLRTENVQLKEQLKEVKVQNSNILRLPTQNDSHATITAPRLSPTTATGNSSNNETDWKAECAKVSLKFNALSENFKKAKDALQRRKAEREMWHDHATLLDKKIRQAERDRGIQILDRSNRASRAPSHLDAKQGTPKPSPNASFASDPGLEQTDLELPPLAAESLHTAHDSTDENVHQHNPQSESTQGESDSKQDNDLPTLHPQDGAIDVRIKEEPSSDTPVMVSERVVKKRKREGPGPNVSAQKVKLEMPDDSSPVMLPGQHTLDTHESIDLGEVAQRMMTPRKRKELEESQRWDELRSGILSTATVTPGPVFVRPDPNPQSARAPERSSVLTPLSVNRRIAQSGGDKPAVSFARGLTHGISVLAEDGGLYKLDPTQGQLKRLGVDPIPKGRLDALLNSPSAQSEERVTPSVRRAREKGSLPGKAGRLSNDLFIPGRRELPFERDKRLRDNEQDQQAGVSSRTGFPSPRQLVQDTRSPLVSKKNSASLLRNKPASELRLEDFKINPQANEGHDFAFTEVVRDRSERDCLPGCTDMHCCGKQFRALALSQRPNPPLTAVQRQEEQKLLEGFLGDHSYRLAAMGKEERDDLWVEAKTQELANKYGKHRHRFSRMRSPPGFWNADFPSTQELEAERVEAGQREKQVIQESQPPSGCSPHSVSRRANHISTSISTSTSTILDHAPPVAPSSFSPEARAYEHPPASISVRDRASVGVAPLARHPTPQPQAGTMSNHHLPAGHNIQGGVGGVPGVDMAAGPGGPRRRQQPYMPQYPQHQHQHQHQHHQQHQHQHQHQHQQMNPMYANYMPYAPQQYYGMPPQQQYQNGPVHSPSYMPYQNYARSPPSMHQHQQYVPMVGVSVPPIYPRPVQQQSPALSTPYQPPPPAPILPHTPSSTHSSQMLPPPTPPTPQTTIQPSEPSPPVVPVQEAPPVEAKEPFQPPLPWLSRPDLDFPSRTPRSRRRRKPLNADSQAVSLPVEQHEAAAEQAEQSTEVPESSSKESKPAASTTASVGHSEAPTTPRPSSEVPAPAASATPSYVQRSRADTATSNTPTAVKPSPRPVLPIVPALPKASTKDVKSSRAEKSLNGEATAATVAQDTASAAVPATPAQGAPAQLEEDNYKRLMMARGEQDILARQEQDKTGGMPKEGGGPNGPGSPGPDVGATEAISNPPTRAPPSSWAKLFAKSAAASGAAPGVAASSSTATTVNGHDAEGAASATNGSHASFSKANASSVAEAVQAYRVGGNEKISFLEPRGLINTGNMCYMNSVLQVLMFCVPFYDFLGQVSKRAVHSFKSETPLIDAMIMFMHEYKVIKSAASVEPLRRALKSDELERYGEPFTPEFVYEAIRQLPRFASMRRGHQQDAEEFLGFLLQSLDDECTLATTNSALNGEFDSAAPPNAASGDSADPTGDWLEVGRKQRAAVSRSSGSSSSSPVTKIFGGLLRSEFRVPGLKDSITTEPYQPLQLDIGAPDVRNVVDALRGLTRPERLQGDFNSPRGKDVVATKQVFIETLPPVLILHLKRFQFDAEGTGTVKIWKNVGYPLELEIPREALSRQTRQTLGEGTMPKYKLISVVYHHGKNASGGHYTVDVRRQEGREWIRLDDTVIRRVRSEDVAEGGEEGDEKDTRKESPALGASGNRFGAMNDEETGEDGGWKQVTVSAGGNKRWSSVVNGTTNGSGKGKQAMDNSKDNKVAYLLFYQRV
ncbi:hypothetical protein G7046_g7108 [Stylonectria norvegica]|nr:hypothetical protein G7046_g7108 [Stylonectria norvegica]